MDDDLQMNDPESATGIAPHENINQPAPGEREPTIINLPGYGYRPSPDLMQRALQQGGAAEAAVVGDPRSVLPLASNYGPAIDPRLLSSHGRLQALRGQSLGAYLPGGRGAVLGGMPMGAPQVGPALPPSRQDPWVKSEVGKLEQSQNLIRQDDTLSDFQRQGALEKIGQQMDALDPGRNYRKDSLQSQQTPVEKAMAENVKEFRDPSGRLTHAYVYDPHKGAVTVHDFKHDKADIPDHVKPLTPLDIDKLYRETEKESRAHIHEEYKADVDAWKAQMAAIPTDDKGRFIGEVPPFPTRKPFPTREQVIDEVLARHPGRQDLATHFGRSPQAPQQPPMPAALQETPKAGAASKEPDLGQKLVATTQRIREVVARQAYPTPQDRQSAIARAERLHALMRLRVAGLASKEELAEIKDLASNLHLVVPEE